MNIEGTYTLQAPPENVWRSLTDPQVLFSAIPGIERVEKIDECTFDVILQLKAPFKGSYQGRVVLIDQQYPYHYRIEIQGKGHYNNLNGTGNIYLNAQDDNTIITYKGTLASNKPNSPLPPSILKGAIKHITQQFFATLATYSRTHAAMSFTETATEAPSIDEETAATSPTQSISTLRRLIQWSGLGAGDPEQEARWETRIRRTGYIAFFLLLVWIGTRIPRRK
ncbi:MAG TPA: SRPBCC domain-containing protein [Ktedonobacteraceae bacterium]